MHKLEIKYLKPEDITKYHNNSRTHSRSQIDQIKASIAEFGMCTPIGVHNGVIVYGHGRFDALRELGHTEIPTVDLSHLSEAQRKAYVIADNKLALNAGWDEEMLKIELQELDEMGFDLELTGFTLDEIGDLEVGVEEDGYSDKNKEVDIESFDDVMELKFKLTFSEYEEANERLKEIANSPEIALKILLKMEV